jgi:hypothetical protein
MQMLGWKAAEPQNICHAGLDGAKGAHSNYRFLRFKGAAHRNINLI